MQMSVEAPTPPYRSEQKYSPSGSAAWHVFVVCPARRQKSTRLAAVGSNRSAVSNASNASRFGMQLVVTTGRPSVGGRRTVGFARTKSKVAWLSRGVSVLVPFRSKELRSTVVTPFAFPFRAFPELVALSCSGTSWSASGSIGANPSLKRTCLRQAA